MRKLFLVLLLAACFRVHAQTGPASTPAAAIRSKEYTEAIRQVLNLTDEQTRKLVDVNTVFIGQIDKLTKTTKSAIEFQQGIQQADRQRVEYYNKIMNARQFKVYEETPQLSGLTRSSSVKADLVRPDTSQAETKKKLPLPAPSDKK